MNSVNDLPSLPHFFAALLVAAVVVSLLWIGYVLGRAITKARTAHDMPAIRQDAVKRSRAVLSGQFSEQLAPYLPDFPWRPTEARFIGKPVDFIVFQGLDDGDVAQIVFVEVKSGGAQLSARERRVRDAVREKRVSWAEYRVPDLSGTDNA